MQPAAFGGAVRWDVAAEYTDLQRDCGGGGGRRKGKAADGSANVTLLEECIHTSKLFGWAIHRKCEFALQEV